MDTLKIERLGGLGGFGGPGSRIRSLGTHAFSTLSPADQQTVEELFRSKGQGSPAALPDEFRYRISRETPNGEESVEIPEAAVPADLRSSVKDELQ